MQIEKYLQKYQPTVYQTFVRSLENNKLSHAYLLIGETGTPLLQIAEFLGKSVLCDEPSPLACDSCITCIRIESENYPDYLVFDGSKSTITDDNVDEIIEKSNVRSVEKKGKIVYVLHLVENMTTKAVNSLLKTLEEPQSEIYAFLTTNNENRILPTIISRCQSLHIKQVDRKNVIEDALFLGVNQDDAELLSYFYNDAEMISKVLSNDKENEQYQVAKDVFINVLDCLKEKDSNKLVYLFQSKVAVDLRSKQPLIFFIDMLVQAFQDIYNLQKEKPIILNNYATILNEIKFNINNVDAILLELMKQRNMMGLNVNIPLQIDHIALAISKEINNG